MKCDSKTPRCSHCVTYEVDCTYAAPSRKSIPRKHRKTAKNRNDINARKSKNSSQHLTESIATSQQQVTTEFDSQDTDESELTRAGGDREQHQSLWLPRTDHILAIVNVYLKDINSIYPLFDPLDIVQMTISCCNHSPKTRDLVQWAAINVVLALAQRHHIKVGKSIPTAKQCIERIEGVLSGVIMGDVQLLNVQVLVGMVTLLQAQQDLKPASILIASTIRLAHSIGLHDSLYSTGLTAREARQRASVFWLAYILDKDLSMRQKQPSIQLDNDINLEIGSFSSDGDSELKNNEHTGIFGVVDKIMSMNYLAIRVQLATVQGAVYDYIYSTRSRNRTSEERFHALQSVSDALKQWRASIPIKLRTSTTSERVRPSILRIIAALHATSLACSTLIHRAHAWDIDWMNNLQLYSVQGIQPRLPAVWDALIVEARELLVLYASIGALDNCDLW